MLLENMVHVFLAIEAAAFGDLGNRQLGVAQHFAGGSEFFCEDDVADGAVEFLAEASL